MCVMNPKNKKNGRRKAKDEKNDFQEVGEVEKTVVLEEEQQQQQVGILVQKPTDDCQSINDDENDATENKYNDLLNAYKNCELENKRLNKELIAANNKIEELRNSISQTAPDYDTVIRDMSNELHEFTLKVYETQKRANDLLTNAGNQFVNDVNLLAKSFREYEKAIDFSVESNVNNLEQQINKSINHIYGIKYEELAQWFVSMYQFAQNNEKKAMSVTASEDEVYEIYKKFAKTLMSRIKRLESLLPSVNLTVFYPEEGDAFNPIKHDLSDDYEEGCKTSDAVIEKCLVPGIRYVSLEECNDCTIEKAIVTIKSTT